MTPAENNVIAGLQWGSESKNRIMDFFANRSEVIVRFNGVGNGGHRISAGEERFILNYLPCGIHHDGKLCIMTSGVALDLERLSDEIAALKSAGVLRARLRISRRCPLILDYHKLLEILDGRLLGSPHDRAPRDRGYGSALADEARRLSVRAGDLLCPEQLREKIKLNLTLKNEYLTKIHKAKALDAEKLCEKILREGQRLAPYIAPVSELVSQAVESNIGTLFEGCGGALNDPAVGIWPDTEAGAAAAPAAFLHSGLRHNAPIKIIGVAKAYCTRSDGGPFITEDKGAISAFIRARGNEYDETTREPRRIGWLDLPALAHAARASGADMLAVTKLDILTGIDELKICTAYRLRGKEIRSCELTAEEAREAEPVYTTLEGWHDEISLNSMDFYHLPAQTQSYLRIIEEYTGLKVIWVGIGARWGAALYKIL
ncbi:MAG: adenylosuccinate synthetase [Synergistaceae bacterium]|nr:adenylosuccinate synthetase [Synergistaceae bacterium]